MLPLYALSYKELQKVITSLINSLLPLNFDGAISVMVFVFGGTLKGSCFIKSNKLFSKHHSCDKHLPNNTYGLNTYAASTYNFNSIHKCVFKEKCQILITLFCLNAFNKCCSFVIIHYFKLKYLN